MGYLKIFINIQIFKVGNTRQGLDFIAQAPWVVVWVAQLGEPTTHHTHTPTLSPLPESMKGARSET